MEDHSEGGYMNSSQKREYTNSRTIRSFTIKQLCNINPDNQPYKIDSHEVTTILIFGHIRATKRTTAGFSFTLDDNTSMIDVTFWPNGLHEEEMSGLITENSFVKVCGTVRVFNSKINVTASHISRIEEFNFLTYHYLNCIYQSLFFNGKLKREIKEHKISEDRGISKIQGGILEVYRKNQDENGLHIDIAVRMLLGKYQEGEIRDNIEILLNECQLYSVDGLEYKTTIDD